MANQYTDRIEAAYDGWGAAYPIAFTALAADTVLYQRPVRICGWAVQEAAAAAAVVRLMGGQSVADGTLIDVSSLASGGVDRSYFGDRGIFCQSGLILDRVSGTVNVSIWIRDWVGDTPPAP